MDCKETYITPKTVFQDKYNIPYRRDSLKLSGRIKTSKKGKENMKKMVKRLLTSLLALAMVLSMGVVPAFAATTGNNGTITVTNPTKGVTYSAYKIFDLSYSGSNHAYTIESSSAFYSAVSSYAATTNSGLTLTRVGETTTYNVEIGSTFKAADFGAAMRNVVAETSSTVTAAAIETADDSSSLTLSNLSYGYYMVVGTKDTTTESLVSLDSTNPTATIVEKNDVPGWHSEDPDPADPDDDPAEGKMIKITNDDGTADYVESTSLNIGDEVTFSIQIDSKNYNGKNLITKYIIKDSLPSGFDFKELKTVKVGNTDLTTQYSNSTFPTGSIGSIEIPWATGSNDDGWTSKYANGALIDIEYTATLNSSAVIDGSGNVNKAAFTYEYGETPENPTPENPPTIPTNPDQWTETDTATVYTYAIALKKINTSGNALAGATFDLPTGMKVNKVEGKTNTYIVANNGDYTSITTNTTDDADASFTIIGVKAGEYQFTETAAPEGYNKLTVPVSVTAQQVSQTTTTTTTTTKFYVAKDGTVTTESVTGATEVTYTNNDYAVTPVAVVNLTGAELPSTGGVGTTMFYVIGTICVLGAGVLLVVRRRMAAR